MMGLTSRIGDESRLDTKVSVRFSFVYFSELIRGGCASQCFQNLLKKGAQTYPSATKIAKKKSELKIAPNSPWSDMTAGEEPDEGYIN